jgi:AraC-like DNA-binding protein
MDPPWAERIQQARQILEQRIANPPSLQELADAVHLSPKRLSSLFQTAFGMTAFAWLREYRMQQAAKLLRTTQLSIGAIAERVGLGKAAFSTQFKKQFLQSPRDYRAMRANRPRSQTLG